DADLVVVDPDRKVIVTNEMVHSSAGWTLWEGREMKGWPVMTVLRDKTIAEGPDGGKRPEIVSKPFGRYQPRSLGVSLPIHAFDEDSPRTCDRRHDECPQGDSLQRACVD